MVAPQTPQFVIYRTTFLSTSKLATEKGVVLGLAGDSAHLISLDISASIETEPNTLTLSFAVPITEGDYNNVSTYLFDFKSNQTIWQVMDQIHVFVSPALEVDSEDNTYKEKYYRIFMGIITNISSNWDGSALTISLTARDLFYWLSLAKIQPKASLSELLLRGQLEGADEKSQSTLLAYKSKYQGRTMKEIINQILLDKKQHEVQGIFLPEFSIRTFLSVIGTGTFKQSIKNIVSATLDKHEEDWEEKYKEQNHNTSLKNTPKYSYESLAQEVEKRQQSIVRTFDNTVSNLVDELSSVSPDLAVQAMLTQRYVRNSIALYWDAQFGQLIRDNYVAFKTVTDHLIVPFPIEWEVPRLFNGEYKSKLDFLKELSLLTIYEIYQAPQGHIFVKPPLYNAPPITTISAEEISNVIHNIDADKILTQVTTHGSLVVGESREQGLRIPMTSEFPFIQGAYTYLFPKGFEENIKETFKESNSEVTVVSIVKSFNSYKDFENFLKINNKKYPSIISISITDFPETPSFSVDKYEEGVPEIFKTSVASILLANSHRFVPSKIAEIDKDKKKEIFLKVFASSIEDILVERGFASILDSSYIDKVVNYYYYKALALHSSGAEEVLSTPKNSVVVPPTIMEIISELSDKGFSYTSSPTPSPTQISISKSTSQPKPSSEIGAAVSESENIKREREKNPLTLPLFLFNITINSKINLDTTNLAKLSTGEYNVLQHGLRTARIDNALIRDNESAVLFSKFIIDKNNASVETTEITLKTLRPDIVPGFPIYNEMDACVYYVADIGYKVAAGSLIETTLKLYAKRRPVWIMSSKAPSGAECSKILNTLQNHGKRPKDVLIGTEVTYIKHEQAKTPKYLVGWEYIGGSTEITETTAIGAFSPKQMVPGFGAVLEQFSYKVLEEKKEEKISTGVIEQYYIGYISQNMPKITFVAPSATPNNPYVVFSIPLAYLVWEDEARKNYYPEAITIEDSGGAAIQTLSSSGTLSNTGEQQRIKRVLEFLKKNIGKKNNAYTDNYLKFSSLSNFSDFLTKEKFILFKHVTFTATATKNNNSISEVMAEFNLYSVDEFKELLTTVQSEIVSYNGEAITTETMEVIISNYKRNYEGFSSLHLIKGE